MHGLAIKPLVELDMRRIAREKNDRKGVGCFLGTLGSGSVFKKICVSELGFFKNIWVSELGFSVSVLQTLRFGSVLFQENLVSELGFSANFWFWSPCFSGTLGT